MSLGIALFLIAAAFLLGGATMEGIKAEDPEDDNPNGWGP